MELQYKCTTWCSLIIPDDVKKEDIIKVLNEGMLPQEIAYNNVIPNMNNVEWKVIDDTEEFLSVEENDGQSTIELMEFQKDNGCTKQVCIWDNSYESEIERNLKEK